MIPVNFADAQLHECYDRNFATGAGLSDEMCQVCALIAAHDFFQMIEGSHSARVHESVEHLLSPGLRPGLREWYRRSGADMNQAAIQFRDQLGLLAGERLEVPDSMVLSPS